MTRVAVVGHVEWVDFVCVDAFPERGTVTAAERAFTHAGGGAVVAAAVLAELGADVDLFCALGRDANGEAAAAELTERGVHVQAAWRDKPTRRVITLLEAHGERTIVTIGERIQPHGDDDLAWDRLERADGVYFTAGDTRAAVMARRARTMVTTPRAREALVEGHVTVDALVYSARDDDEVSWAQRLEPRAQLMVATEGGSGGCWWGDSRGRWTAVDLPGAPRDDYGCGDSFAAGFTFGLAQRLPVQRAAQIGAERGAWALTQVGAP
ncbi:MAG: ribokinase [Solirubrobacteraceae bacterium]|nr:ribokinase [Solirubrobacteraceae bacterium]